MPTYRVLKAASYRIDEIYGYSWDQWGEEILGADTQDDRDN